MQESIFFNTTYLEHGMLVVSGTRNGKQLPQAFDDAGVASNTHGALYHIGRATAGSLDPIRLIVGNRKPEHTKLLHATVLQVEEKTLYIGDDLKQNYFSLVIPSEKTDLEIRVDSLEAPTLLYVYIVTSKLSISKQNWQHPSQEIYSQIQEIGHHDGCHICGNRQAAKYIPHLLPAIELDYHVDERSYYPICEKDYARYQAEVKDLLLDLI